MTVKDLWTMWDELRMKTVVDIYTSDGVSGRSQLLLS